MHFKVIRLPCKTGIVGGSDNLNPRSPPPPGRSGLNHGLSISLSPRFPFMTLSILTCPPSFSLTDFPVRPGTLQTPPA